MEKFDAILERILIYLENMGVKKEFMAWIGSIADGVRQIYGHISVKRAWRCWLLVVITLMAGSCFSCWRWMQGATSRSERQELRARRVQARMQLKAILFITLVPFSQGMEGQAPGENAFLQQMPQQQQMLPILLNVQLDFLAKVLQQVHRRFPREKMDYKLLQGSCRILTSSQENQGRL